VIRLGAFSGQLVGWDEQNRTRVAGCWFGLGPFVRHIQRLEDDYCQLLRRNTDTNAAIDNKGEREARYHYS
jgi:hypothetical protein